MVAKKDPNALSSEKQRDLLAILKIANFPTWRDKGPKVYINHIYVFHSFLLFINILLFNIIKNTQCAIAIIATTAFLLFVIFIYSMFSTRSYYSLIILFFWHDKKYTMFNGDYHDNDIPVFCFIIYSRRIGFKARGQTEKMMMFLPNLVEPGSTSIQHHFCRYQPITSMTEFRS